MDGEVGTHILDERILHAFNNHLCRVLVHSELMNEHAAYFRPVFLEAEKEGGHVARSMKKQLQFVIHPASVKLCNGIFLLPLLVDLLVIPGHEVCLADDTIFLADDEVTLRKVQRIDTMLRTP